MIVVGSVAYGAQRADLSVARAYFSPQRLTRRDTLFVTNALQARTRELFLISRNRVAITQREEVTELTRAETQGVAHAEAKAEIGIGRAIEQFPFVGKEGTELTDLIT